MADIFDDARKIFPGGEEKFAEALLFRSNDGTRRSLRVEADSIGLEFTDNTYFGIVVQPPSTYFVFHCHDFPTHCAGLQVHHMGEARLTIHIRPRINLIETNVADPEGFLFYRSLQEFRAGVSGSTRYTVTQEKNPANQRDCLRVKFVDVSTNVCYAQVRRQISLVNRIS